MSRIGNYLRHLPGIFCVLMVFSVPLSRVYLGVHWFTDVLAGFFLGLVLLIGLLKWYSWARKSIKGLELRAVWWNLDKLRYGLSGSTLKSGC